MSDRQRTALVRELRSWVGPLDVDGMPFVSALVGRAADALEASDAECARLERACRSAYDAADEAEAKLNYIGWKI